MKQNGQPSGQKGHRKEAGWKGVIVARRLRNTNFSNHEPFYALMTSAMR